MAVDGRRRVVLLACGSFNPITDQHLRLFEIARDALHKTGRYQVIAGVISPVNDHYGKKDLAAANHRCDMVKLALESSTWVRVDMWEANQNEWLETVKVLRYQKESFDARYRNGGQSATDSPESSTKRRRMNSKNKIISASATDGTYDHNDNNDIEVKLLCGADVLESFAVPELWKQEHMEEIVSKFGMVVCTRNGSNLEKFIYESDLLSQYKNNIILVTEWITNDISASKVRRALRRGESVKYLLQDSVIDYIRKNGLYGTVDDNKLMNSFTLSPTDPRSPEPPTQNARVESEQGENRQSRDGMVTVQKPIRHERDACNNFVLDKGQTRCCNAFLLTTRSSVDNYDGRRQVLPNNAKHANDQRRLLKLSFDGAKESKYTTEIASCDSTKNAAEIKAEKQSGTWSGVKGRSGGRLVEKRGGSEIQDREDTLFANVNNNYSNNNNNNNNNTRLRREDAFDSLLSSENDRPTSRALRNSAGGDSLDSSGRSPVDSSPPSPQPQKKTISCMVADVFGLVRRFKRLGFSHEARLNN